MEFRKPEPKYIDEAVELAIREYKNECANNKQLLVKNYRNTLKELITDIFNSKYGLVAYTMKKLANEGVRYLGVDCETLNPTALRFWSKYFEFYTYSFVRRVDERILD